MSRIKRYFGAGLLITVPLFVTFYLLYIVFQFIDSIWGKVINYYLRKNFGFSIPGLGFILGVITVFLVGFITTNFLGKRLFHFFESFFIRIPLVRQIYSSARQIVDSFLSKEKKAFKKVVLVEYPSKGIWSIGFITNEGFKQANDAAGRELVHVFIATTPSPLTGFLILMPRDEIKMLDIPVEDGIKLIVSGGIVKPHP